ncbi:MAG: hypothetical protein WBA51_02735 [Erythrobacter sp.]
MSFFFGQLVGSVIAIGVLSAILRLVLKRFLVSTQLVLATVLSAVAIATFLYAFGSADGGEPKFGESLTQYGIGGVVVIIVWLFAQKRGAKDNG